ncbi:FUSC family protein [Chenggangzhangella methanolivorans]|uniref:FUSC family protein n=1 Tax=Chenggangzhangella methanolivorans TaxID=1437009 RepID=A0A9E6R667_9HYPH|nr:FUSC family protein [Chenggangzhangella methanolivorans]QZN98942.1 FUSC family protein [Chenggangzhangella methanolivorans]
MSAPDPKQLIFAARTTAAALLAAFIAFLVHLPQASTSMITVFIVSQPLAGMVLSKSLFRGAGTAAGAVAAIAFTSAFSNAPELFALAVSLWIGGCVAASVYLRDAPAAYGAMLSGYSVAIIAFPAVEAPDTIFQAALDRGSEIMVGIACATVLSQIVFPQSAADTLKAATLSVVSSASRWAADTLRGRPDPAAVLADRRALVAKVTALDGLRVQASFDSLETRRSNRALRLLHARIVNFLALLVSIHDRLEILRAERPAALERMEPLLAQAADAMSPEAGADRRAAAKAALLSATPDFEALAADRARLIERTVLLRTADLVALRDDLDRARPAGAGDGDDASLTIARYRDHGLAFVAGLCAFVAVGAVCAFWIATGWKDGAGAAIMTAVMMSLFAQADDPSAAAGGFFKMTAVGSVVAGAYAYAILPGLEGFEALALALAPFLFAAAYAMTIPRYTLPALASALGALNAMGLVNVMTPDFASFANGALAQLFGIGLAAALLSALRPIGAAWPVARLTSGLYADLAEAVAGRSAPSRVAFESRILDRVDGLMRRLDLSDPNQLALEQGALASIRIGLNAIALRGVARDLPDEVSAPLVSALAATARHFRRLARGEASAPPLAELDRALDAALDARLADRPDAADAPVWIAALRGGLAHHPRMFGEAEPTPAPEHGPLKEAA